MGAHAGRDRRIYSHIQLHQTVGWRYVGHNIRACWCRYIVYSDLVGLHWVCETARSSTEDNRVWTESFPPPSKSYRYQKIYILARVVLVVVILGVAVLATALYKRKQELHNKITILVADFYTENAARYQVSDEIFSQLRLSLSKYSDTRLILLDEPIREQDSEKATRLGKRYDADFVIWGRYAVTTSDVQVTIHITNLGQSVCGFLASTKDYEAHAGIGELDHFVLQPRLKKEMGALILFVSGWSRFQARDFSESISYFDESLSLGNWPDSMLSKAVIFMVRGEALSQMGNTRDALESFTSAIKIDSHFGPAYADIGGLYFSSKNYQQAIRYFTLAIENEPTMSTDYSFRALAYTHVNEMDSAIEDAHKAIELCPGNPDGYHALGHAYSEKGNLEKARESFSKAAEFVPNDIAAHLELGQLLQRVHDHRAAIDQFRKAIKLNPESAVAYEKLGITYQAIGDLPEAVRCLRKATEIDPQFAEAYRLLALSYELMANFEQAIDSYKRAIEIDPQFANGYQLLGSAYFSMANYEQAIESYGKAIDLNRGDFESAYGLGIVYAAIPERDVPNLFAARPWQHVMQMLAPTIENDLQESAKCSDHRRRAIEWFSRAIAINDHSSAAYENRAQMYVHCGKDQLALGDFNRAIALDDTAATTHIALGELYMKLKRNTEAMDCFFKVLEISTDNDLLERAYFDLLLLKSE